MTRLKVGLVLGLLTGAPAWVAAQGPLVFVGGGFGAPQRGYLDLTVLHAKHVTVGGQLGMGGLKAGAGFWLLQDETHYHDVSLVNALVMRAVVVQTWGSPLAMDPHRAYAGLEVEGSFYFVPNFHVGVVWPLHRRHERDDMVVTAGVGFRLPINLGWMGGGS